MAAMFYSLQEAAERLGKTEADIREIVQSGKLREFRDGPNLLFKVDEVDALAPQAEILLELDIPQAPVPQPPGPSLSPNRIGGHPARRVYQPVSTTVLLTPLYAFVQQSTQNTPARRKNTQDTTGHPVISVSVNP